MQLVSGTFMPKFVSCERKRYSLTFAVMRGNEVMGWAGSEISCAGNAF